jgi:hypothetical protein
VSVFQVVIFVPVRSWSPYVMKQALKIDGIGPAFNKNQGLILLVAIIFILF